MTLGEAVTYADCLFPTTTEAQWAVYFHHLGEHWEYRADGDWQLPHHRPQFYVLRNFEHTYFLAVRPHLDHHQRRVEPAASAELVYLAVGAVPDTRQMRATGWWDGRRESGVLNLTTGPGWDQWYPPRDRAVLEALRAAHAERFQPAMPTPGRGDGGAARGMPRRPREREM